MEATAFMVLASRALPNASVMIPCWVDRAWMKKSASVVKKAVSPSGQRYSPPDRAISTRGKRVLQHNQTVSGNRLKRINRKIRIEKKEEPVSFASWMSQDIGIGRDFLGMSEFRFFRSEEIRGDHGSRRKVQRS